MFAIERDQKSHKKRSVGRVIQASNNKFTDNQ